MAGTPINHVGPSKDSRNAAKRLEWLDSYDLSTPEGVDGFLREVVKATWTGALGSRAAGCLNSQIKLLQDRLMMQTLEKRVAQLESEKRR